MSEINYQALREAAVAAETESTHQNFVTFRMAFTPSAALALLDEINALEETRINDVCRIAELTKQLESAKSKLNEQREYYEGVISDGSKRIAELEKSEEQLINERDHAESALADMYFAATGGRPEWSNCFSFSDAVDAVVDRIADLEAKQPSPVVPVVPHEWRLSNAQAFIERYSPPSVEEAALFAWNACRAAMRKAGNSPVTPDGWISCSERMPNDAQWCVVNTEYGYYVQCWSESQGWLGDDISIPKCDVINWMPLPEPPQEVK